MSELYDQIKTLTDELCSDENFKRIVHGWVSYVIEQAAQPQWLPIESAPKDGTWILLGGCKFGHFFRVANWRLWNDEQGLDWCDYTSRGFQPTHYMPLPSPPEDDKENRDG